MELLRALGAYCEAPGEGHPRLATALGLPVPTRSEWHATFVERFYPYGSVYLGNSGFLGGEVRDAVAGVFRALDADPPEEADHLAVLLAGYATVDANRWAPARGALLWEHILPWTLPWLDRVRHDAPACYRQWADLLWDVLVALADEVQQPGGPTPVFASIPVGLADPRTGPSDDFVASLLAPARLGAILTRDDLLAAARTLELPARLAERRYVLRGLLSQDPAAVLGWLAGHCATFSGRASAWPAAVSCIGAVWADRARASAATLQELAEAAQGADLAGAPRLS